MYLLVKYLLKKFSSDHTKVSVIVPLYNKERTIGNLIKRLRCLFPLKNIFVINDASTDRSFKIAQKYGKGINIIDLKKNVGKVGAISFVMSKITTPFTLILDADVMLGSDFKCPTSLLDEKITACSFNVMPMKTGKILCDLQSHEYAKSMELGRRFQDITSSVSCISGAAGLFQTERLRELTNLHSNNWDGEDFERTLIELDRDGKVSYVPELVETEVPKRFVKLIKQRITGWWPGLWRNIPIMLKLMMKPSSHFLFKIDLFYQLFSLFTDIFKIITLFTVIYNKCFIVLLTMYFLYLILDVLSYKKIGGNYLEYPKTTLALYPIYNVAQMLMRVAGLFVLIKKYLRTKMQKT